MGMGMGIRTEFVNGDAIDTGHLVQEIEQTNAKIVVVGRSRPDQLNEAGEDPFFVHHLKCDLVIAAVDQEE